MATYDHFFLILEKNCKSPFFIGFISNVSPEVEDSLDRDIQSDHNRQQIFSNII